jgi:tetratricopeptide (TPR) repeat protein
MAGLGRILFIGLFVGGFSALAVADAGWFSGPQAAAPGGVWLAAVAPGGDDATPNPDNSPDAKPAAAPPAQTREQKLDDLFIRLAASKDAAETNGLIAAIDRLHLQSGSDTSDFLMGRAVAALGIRNLAVSRALLDQIVLLRPGWAEAWNKRATVRYLQGDERGSMADIARVLVLEPRHFGALSGMAMILERGGFRDDALRAYRRALEIAPQLASLRAAVDRLAAEVRGQSL